MKHSTHVKFIKYVKSIFFVTTLIRSSFSYFFWIMHYAFMLHTYQYQITWVNNIQLGQSNNKTKHWTIMKTDRNEQYLISPRAYIWTDSHRIYILNMFNPFHFYILGLKQNSNFVKTWSIKIIVLHDDCIHTTYTDKVSTLIGTWKQHHNPRETCLYPSDEE